MSDSYRLSIETKKKCFIFAYNNTSTLLNNIYIYMYYILKTSNIKINKLILTFFKFKASTEAELILRM